MQNWTGQFAFSFLFCLEELNSQDGFTAEYFRTQQADPGSTVLEHPYICSHPDSKLHQAGNQC